MLFFLTLLLYDPLLLFCFRISALGYLCYPPGMSQYWMKKFKLLAINEELSDFHPDTIVIFAASFYIFLMLLKVV